MRLAVLAALLLAAPAAAQPAPPFLAAGEGERIARQWCANCHAVAPGMMPPAGDAALSFPAIAALPATTETSLRAFLQMPHANMPDFGLSRADLDAVVAYILALRR